MFKKHTKLFTVLVVIVSALMLMAASSVITSLTFTPYTVGTLPAAASNSGRTFLVTDGTSAADCSSGSSSHAALCRSNGSVYQALGAPGTGGGTTNTIASGTATLGTSSISSATCASVVTVTATGAATTDVVTAGFNGDPTAVTGYIPSTSGMLAIFVYPTSGHANFKVCNNTSSSITPGAITLNWLDVR